ncbi:pilus assembly protein N-terminal domain-containing protein [Vibrio sp. S4M6]|uniref:type II and III secretion system protein family protein n=1 Tax=Vibrio sinus TaxID=2946865 RepID=UPI002029C481|nr:pilus assembly protein N-terminal domain-containing protein [Vibrio sinus]MCL9783349.1 pilus assembly protein N-terminal domain-containing protein [Vibrio sinus]
MSKLVKKILILLTLSLLSFTSMASSLINLAAGQAKSITLKSDVSSVFISAPKVADYQVIGKRKVVVYGKSLGQATVIIFGKSGATLINKTIVVNQNLTAIQQYIAIKFPNTNVNVFNVGNQVVLSGVVSTETQKREIANIVGTLLKRKLTKQKLKFKAPGRNKQDQELYAMENKVFDDVVNNIEVAATKQVNVKLTIAEVSQSFLEEIGFRFGGIADGTSSGTFTSPITGIKASNLLVAIKADQSDTVSKVLAEPNLSVISGETASFLVGGQLPLAYTLGNTATVRYKDYGIQLNMAAKVQSDDKIRLTLAPEVSEIDNSYQNENYDLPALKTRREKTTIELGDGQSFVLGGLLSTKEIEKLSKVPLLGDIPILGTLFRDAATTRKKTELVIVATVNLVKPIAPSQIQLPEMKKTTTLNRFFGLSKHSFSKASDSFAKELLATGGFKQ